MSSSGRHHARHITSETAGLQLLQCPDPFPSPLSLRFLKSLRHHRRNGLSPALTPSSSLFSVIFWKLALQMTATSLSLGSPGPGQHPLPLGDEGVCAVQHSWKADQKANALLVLPGCVLAPASGSPAPFKGEG